MKKIGLLALAAILALGAMGVGYAAWTQTLAINGTVSTGTFSVYFDNAWVDDSEDWQGLPDVAQTTASIGPDGSLTVNITNGYPCYADRVGFHFVNGGSIPARITSIKLNGVEFTDERRIDLNGNGNNDISVYLSLRSMVGQVIGAGDDTNAAFRAHVCSTEVEGNDADQGITGSFTFTIETIQAIGG